LITHQYCTYLTSTLKIKQSITHAHPCAEQGCVRAGWRLGGGSAAARRWLGRRLGGGSAASRRRLGGGSAAARTAARTAARRRLGGGSGLGGGSAAARRRLGRRLGGGAQGRVRAGGRGRALAASPCSASHCSASRSSTSPSSASPSTASPSSASASCAPRAAVSQCSGGGGRGLCGRLGGGVGGGARGWLAAARAVVGWRRRASCSSPSCSPSSPSCSPSCLAPATNARHTQSAVAERAPGRGQGASHQTLSVRGRCWWGQCAGLRSSSSRV
jgi:hypothetical protein